VAVADPGAYWLTFGQVETGAQIVAGSVIQDIEQRLFVRLAGQPAVRRGIVLPEGAQVARLPTLHRFGLGFKACIRGQLVLDSPAADAGPVGFEVEAAKQFAACGTVGAGRFRGEKLLEQLDDLGWPVGTMIPAGGARRPVLRMTVSTSQKVLAEELVEAAAGQTQFFGGSAAQSC